jgi:hypothetical protein
MPQNRYFTALKENVILIFSEYRVDHLQSDAGVYF